MLGALRKDARFISRSLKALRRISVADPTSATTVGDVFEGWVDAHRDRTAVIFEGRKLTYAELDALANRFAHWGLAQGLKPGASAGLLMINRPEYVACWFGLLKIGVRVALLNTNLQGRQLAHCINIAEAETLILDAELAGAFESARGELETSVGVWRFGAANGGPGGDHHDLDAALEAASQERPSPSVRQGLTQDAVGLYIYTSGTTGLPKAAKIKHYRVLMMALGYSAYVGPTAEDRMYVPLPLYHATGGCCAVGATLCQGGAVVLTRKFSASRFWSEVRENAATMFVYVGELCRYLVNAKPSSDERGHRVRRIFGNGMRPDVWPKFVERFGVTDIVEFYAATESPVFLFNVDGKEGSVGRVPWYLRYRFPFKIVKFDHDAEVPVRGPDGRLVEADFGEAGELIGPIDPAKASARFEGYSDEEATKSKILRDAFKEGDMWFRTGDILKKDREGYHYFVDRIGDTFRWKGENVSTLEVAHTLSAAPGVEQVTVYGVEVPGHDGRAGMAAAVFSGEPDLDALSAVVERDLAPYARPVFLRVRTEIEATGTFKERKVELVKDGFDPDAIADPVYVFDAETKRYRRLDAAGRQAILSGAQRI